MSSCRGSKAQTVNFAPSKLFGAHAAKARVAPKARHSKKIRAKEPLRCITELASFARPLRLLMRVDIARRIMDVAKTLDLSQAWRHRVS